LNSIGQRVPWMFAAFDVVLPQDWKKRRGDVLAALEARNQKPLEESAKEPTTVEPA
jgi:hypothetical protein